MSRGGGQINYREEEKKILDSILGKDVYDNRIRPSGLNGTGNDTLLSRVATSCLRMRKTHAFLEPAGLNKGYF